MGQVSKMQTADAINRCSANITQLILHKKDVRLIVLFLCMHNCQEFDKREKTFPSGRFVLGVCMKKKNEGP